MPNRDWREAPNHDEETTPGGIRTGSEVLADLEACALEAEDRIREYAGWPTDQWTVVGTPCVGCGAFIQSTPCRLCGEGKAAA